MVRLTDRSDMTSDVYRGRKTTTQQQKILLPNNVMHNRKASRHAKCYEMDYSHKLLFFNELSVEAVFDVF